MKTMMLSLAILLCAPACVTAAGEPESDQVATGVSSVDEEPSDEDGAARVETIPVLAPAYAEPGSCASCGPGPQPWQGSIWIRPGR